MRQSLFALATAAFLLAACGETPKTSTPTGQSTTVTTSVGSPVTASGKMRIALLLPLSGRSAPVGQSLQQAAEMALFDTGAKELALAAYDSGETADTAVEAYRKARIDGAALVLGPLFGTSATALAPLVSQGGANVVSFSNDEQAAQRGVWIMGIAAPPQVRRVVDHAVDAGVKRFAAFAPQTSVRPADGPDHGEPGHDPRRQGGRGRAVRRQQRRSQHAGATAGRGFPGRGQARRAGAGGAAAALGGAGRAGGGGDRQQVGAADRHRRVGRAQYRLGSDAARRLVCRARPGQAGRLRAAVPVDLRPAAASLGDACL